MAKGHAGGLGRKECESRGTLLELLERYPDEEPCERRLLEEKHPGGFVCPVCGNRTCSKVHGHAHKWQCTRCSRQLSVTAGTMMEGTRLPLRKWSVAIWPMSSQKAGISACSLQRQIGCSCKASGRMPARMRCAMAGSECVQRPRCWLRGGGRLPYRREGRRHEGKGHGAAADARCRRQGSCREGTVRHPLRTGLPGRLMAPVRARPPLPCIDDKGGRLDRHIRRALVLPRPRAEGARQLGRRCPASHGPQDDPELQGIRGGSLPRPLQEAHAVLCGLLQLEVQPQGLRGCLQGPPPWDVPHARPALPHRRHGHGPAEAA